MLKPEDQKEEFAKAVCLFLAEQLRIKKIGLRRSAEIAQKVVQNLNLLDTEADFLGLVKELAKDFEELAHLEQRIFMHMEISKRRNMEVRVKEFVISTLSMDAQLAMQIMQEAINENITEQDLINKFPQYAEYVRKINDKPGAARGN